MRDRLPMWQRMFGTPSIASCREVTRTLQSYLDGHAEQTSSRRIQAHLEMCRRCGLEAGTYTAIKSTLARRPSEDPDAQAVARLRDFAARLLEEEDDHPAPAADS